LDKQCQLKDYWLTHFGDEKQIRLALFLPLVGSYSLHISDITDLRRVQAVKYMPIINSKNTLELKSDEYK